MKQRKVQAVKMLVRFKTHADTVKHLRGREDNLFEARWGYFFSHGKSPANFMKRITAVFGKDVLIPATGDHRDIWPKNSYFWVQFKVSDNLVADAVTAVEELLAEAGYTWKEAWEETQEYFRG